MKSRCEFKSLRLLLRTAGRQASTARRMFYLNQVRYVGPNTCPNVRGIPSTKSARLFPFVHFHIPFHSMLSIPSSVHPYSFPSSFPVSIYFNLLQAGSGLVNLVRSLIGLPHLAIRRSRYAWRDIVESLSPYSFSCLSVWNIGIRRQRAGVQLLDPLAASLSAHPAFTLNACARSLA